MNSIKKHPRLVKTIYKTQAAGDKSDRTSIISSVLRSMIDPMYQVRKFREIYPIYAPKFLIAVANK